jgi:NAD(P)-dependent dehydrogenase (short-subunit alcohol dehydrogenase family)
MRLAGKVAIVTGGASGMGRAIALRMADEAAHVLVGDLDSEGGRRVAEEARTRGGTCTALTVDVTRRADMQQLTRAAVDTYGRIDILVNNAGVRVIRPFLEHTDEDWDRMLDVNLRSQFLGAQAVLPTMLEQGGGRIINNASVAALVGRPNRAAYCAAKAGVLGLTRALAIDVRHTGITVNALVPGSITTALNREPAEDPSTDWGGETLVGRWGDPTEVAAAAVFLASDEASYVTGAELRVEGGWLAARARHRET